MRGGNSTSHRRSRNIGEDFEGVVDVWHSAAGLRGALAHVIHNMPPSKFVNGQLMYEKPGAADYTGVLHGGQYLAAEAKSVIPDGRLTKSRISPLQQQHLNAVEAAGGLAFLLVEFRVHHSVNHRQYAIPWHEVPWKVLRSAESLDECDIAVCYQVPAGSDYLLRYHPGSDSRYIVGKVKHVYPTE